MARGVWAGALVTGVVTVGGGVARASGHELNALDDVFQAAAVAVGAVPWAISWFLLARESSPAVSVWGMLTAGAALVMVLLSGIPPLGVYVSVALLPAVAHLLKRVRAVKRAQRGIPPEPTGDR